MGWWVFLYWKYPCKWFSAKFKSAQALTFSVQLDMFNSVTLDDNEKLLKPIQDSEIKGAVFQMDKFKAPGPDGFGAAFFQNHWHIVKDEGCNAIRSFFEEGKLLKQINHTLIALIPKVNNPTTTNQF